MADYTCIYEAGNALVDLFRRNLTPEPIGKPELIGLCPPFEPEDFQLTVHLLHIEDGTQSGGPAYVQESVNTQRIAPLPLKLSFLITAHSKAPVQTRAADEYRIMGRVIQLLRDNSRLSGAMLTGSLLESETALNVSLTKANFEQMTKLWASSSKPYKLSVACTVMPVPLSSNRVRTVGRVKDAEFHIEETPVRRRIEEENQ